MDKTIKPPFPFSLRLSEDEREILQERAGNLPLGAYIRSQLFSQPKPRRKRRSVEKNYAALVRLLSLLGHAEILKDFKYFDEIASDDALPAPCAQTWEKIRKFNMLLKAIYEELNRSLDLHKDTNA